MNMITNLFGGGASKTPTPANTTAANPNGGNPGNMPANAGTTDQKNTTVPAGGAGTETAENKSKSPLDNFTEFANIDPNADAPKPLKFDADPAKILEAAKNVDFKQYLSPETLKKIADGGTAAQEAFAQAMNAVAQGTYARSAQVTTAIVEQALQKQAEQFEKTIIPNLVKKLNIGEHRSSQNPALNHPAVKPYVEKLEAQIASKNPSWSASEVSKAANEYFAGIASAFSAASAASDPASSSKSQDIDWSDFLV